MENLSCQAKATTTATTRTTRSTRTTTTTTPSPLNNDGGGVEFETGSNRLQFDSMCSLNANFARKLVDSDESKIVNGQVALSSSWPWIVRMSFRFDSGSGLCGGSIIDDEWVLTAAHCCDNARSVQMTISDHNQAGRDSGEFSVTSSKIFIHPFYQRGNGLDWDVCLIKTPRLSSRSNNQSVFGAACIPRSMPNLHGKHCWVAGWGVGSEGGASQLLLNEVGVNIFSHEYCVNNSIYGNFIVEEAEICAGIPDRNNDGVADGGKDACQGDSGGPLICVEKGKPVLYGVVSWGEGCARRGAPGIYANVNAALEWIDDTILRN